MNSDHQLHDTEPLDNPNGGLHHRDNVTIRSGSAGSNGSNSIGNNKLTTMFASITEEQKFVQKLTWAFIALFFLLTIYIN